MEARRRRVVRHSPGSVTTSPRRIASGSTPTRLSAVRLPGSISLRRRWWDWIPRMRARTALGSTSISWSSARPPPVRVPVTTVPEPFIEKTRSTQRRGRRLPALVGRHHEDGGVDGADPRQHVADEPLVTRDVDDPHLPARRQLEPGEAQVDGETPTLLLLEAVRVDAGQRLDECALAVVDVTGRRNDVHG